MANSKWRLTEPVQKLINSKRMVRYLPLISAQLVLIGTVGALELRAFSWTSGKLVYPLDDPYIHMAIAKQLAIHGIWGVSSAGFSSASSSPLWTLLVAVCFKCVGVFDWIPLAINLAAGTGIVFLAWFFLEEQGIPRFQNLVVLTTFIYLVPIPTLIISGQEHVLHILICLLFAYLVVRQCSAENPSWLSTFYLTLLAPQLTFLRYEGVFLLLVGVGLLILRKRFWGGFSCLAAGLLPIVLFGCFSEGNGAFFVPNSVLLKGSVPSFGLNSTVMWLVRRLRVLWSSPHVPLLALAALATLYQKLVTSITTWSDRALLWLLIFLATLIPHSLFASYGWFFRYEAYIVSLGLAALIVFSIDSSAIRVRQLDRLEQLRAGERQKLATYCIGFIFFFLLCFPLLVRALDAIRLAPKAVKNIYEQQYQMAIFAKKYYDRETIALNDVGAVSYYTNARIVDLEGLASTRVVKMKFSESYDTGSLRQMVAEERPSIIMVYENWFNGGRNPSIPHEWIRIGSWTIRDNVVCGGDQVSFFVLDQTEVERAITNLSAFGACLPRGVIVNGIRVRAEVRDKDGSLCYEKPH